jgi:simple sugar transport system permease protein
MLVGALAGVACFIVLGGDPGVALLVSAVAAMIASMLFALLTVILRVNQVIAGIAFVFFCQGATTLTGTMEHWSNHAIVGLPPVSLGALSTLPIVGHIVFSQDILVYLTIPIFFVVQRFLFRSEVGLHLRAVGETPDAADAAGLSIAFYRFAAVVGGACLIGLAGGYISVVSTKIWIPGMTSGRGWIAVALVIFARWRPWRALAGALLFGCIEALIPRVAAAGIKVPQYFVLMTPYIATIIVMTWATVAKRGASDEPGALGQPFVREERR